MSPAGREPAATAGVVGVPSGKRVREVLGGAIAREVGIEHANPLAPGRPSLGHGIYVRGRLQTCGLLVMDLPLACYVGAAASRLARGGAEDCLARGELSSIVARGWTETMTAVTALFGEAGAGPAALYDVYPPGALPPADVTALAARWGRRLDLTVRVAGYGAGRLALVLA